MSVTGSSFDFKDTIINREEGYIKSTSTKIEDKNVFFTLLFSFFLTFVFFVETISNSSGSWFIDDSSDRKTSDLTSIFSGLSLGVIEIGWASNNGVFNWGVKMVFSDFFHFTKDHRGDLFRMEFLDFTFKFNDNKRFIMHIRFEFERPSFHIFLDMLVFETSSDKSFGIEDSVCWVSGGLVFSGFTDFSFLFSKGDIGWSSSVSLFIFNDNDFLFFHDSNTRVGGTEINTDARPVTFFLRHVYLIVFV